MFQRNMFATPRTTGALNIPIIIATPPCLFVPAKPLDRLILQISTRVASTKNAFAKVDNILRANVEREHGEDPHEVFKTSAEIQTV